MMNIYAKAYADVYYILSAVEEKYTNKIPKDLIEFFKDNAEPHYLSTIDLTKPLTEQKISEETEQLICLLNLNYWCTPEEKEALLEKYKMNDEKIQELLQIENGEGVAEDNIENAYAEVEQILDFLGDSYKQKVPESLRKLFKENKNENHKILIRQNTKLEDISLCRTTVVILSILNLKYWETNANKKEKLKKIYDDNEVKYQEKINLYKNDDWLKNKKTRNESIGIQNKTSIIEIKKYSIIDKIKMFFRNLFHKKK